MCIHPDCIACSEKSTPPVYCGIGDCPSGTPGVGNHIFESDVRTSRQGRRHGTCAVCA
jgi:hypothetical protein